ncbi:MAG: 3'-5' exonuclease, partial [Demequina sp.]|uniref:3'-5' exonuclease n=1 Tax=Demequina sp. TaxID=2050685 RepID=UPI003A86BE59
FAAAGIDATGLKASTFHAFGLDILEKASGSRPQLAPWVANGTELEHVEGILADLVASGDLSPEDRLEAGDRLAALLLDLMGHVKAAGLTKAELRRALSGRRDEEATRARRVLDLYWRVHERWDIDLAAAGAVDYPAMLSDAARALEKKPRLVDADLVLVDEFQDTSPARARLVRALTRAAHTSLLVVGDDWQAINRFTGADMSLLTEFSAWSGPSLTRRLETTYRTTQVIADVAGRFIARNPSQITKNVTAARGPGGEPVRIVRVSRRSDLAGAIATHVERLAAAHPGATIDVLGRYRADEEFVSPGKHPEVTVTFRTIHASKGLEADHVIVPSVVTGPRGFPSTRSTDPVIELAMAGRDEDAHAEERRLLYVALTRARTSVTLFTVEGSESPFIDELLEDPDVTVEHASVRAATAPGASAATV